MWGDWAEILQIERVIYWKKPNVLNSTFHAKWSLFKGQVIPVLVHLGFGTSQENWGQKPKIKGTDTQKVIKSVKLHISHQTKHYSRIKTNSEPSYTSFSAFRELKRVEKIGLK